MELTQACARLAELRLRVVAHADEVGAGELAGATSTANWLAHATRVTRTEAHSQVRLARALTHHDATRAALATGQVLGEQAKVICEAVDALPDELPATRERCEAHLVGLAADHDARALRILGKHVLAVVDPDAGDAHEAKLLEAEEAAAAKATRFTLHDDGHGQCHGRFTLPAAQGAMLKKALMAFAAPKHQRATGGTYDHLVPTPQRLGQAFAAYVERYPADRLPHTSGVNATVVVTVALETLLGGLAAASLDTGHRISAGQARRLACEAGIVPAVLGGTSQVLDLGRRRRFHTPAQRTAIGIQQRHCTHPTCDVPAAFCHVHHDTPWAKGGPTDTTTARLLCPRHHTLAHRPTPMRL